jgi:hypothetical protein
VARGSWRRGALALGAAVLVAGCGAQPSQDEDEPEGEFPLAVSEARFPTSQSLAQDSRLVIDVRNVGDETVPNISVTVTGFDRKLRNPSNPAEVDPEVADPSRPVFVVDRSPQEFALHGSRKDASLVERETSVPYGRETVYVNTYSLGELAPDDNALFRWDVSAVQAGQYKIRYEVNAGLDGNAVAVSEGGKPLTGSFSGVIESTPPPASISSDGKTIVSEEAKPSGGGGQGVILGD